MPIDTNQANLNSITTLQDIHKSTRAAQFLPHSGNGRCCSVNEESHPYCTGFSTTTSSTADSGFSSRCIFLTHACCSKSLLSDALFFESDDASVFDSDERACGAPSNEEGCTSSESWDDKLLGESNALPAFCCSSKIFCKYLACSSIRSWRTLCTYAKNSETSIVILNP